MEANLTYVGMGQWACNDCGYQSQKSNVKRHVESRHLVPTQYTCQLCQRVFHGKNLPGKVALYVFTNKTL